MCVARTGEEGDEPPAELLGADTPLLSTAGADTGAGAIVEVAASLVGGGDSGVEEAF